MLRYRPEIQRLIRYEAGRDMNAVMREHGLDSIIKLASNECPYPPFPPVMEVMAAAGAGVNRYPDNDYFELRSALSAHLDVPAESVWVGAGSSELLRNAALAVGGPGTSAVMPWPSFAMYPIGTYVAGAEPIKVPLDDEWVHDLDAMRMAIREDTTIVYLCNPNNPTGTILPGDAIEAFVRSLPASVLVVVDEAYGELATDQRFRTMLPLALELPNVLYLRTFSKVYGLAGLRVGYGVAQPDTVRELQKPQAPFVVSVLGEAAAIEALRHQDLVAERVAENAVERAKLEAGLAERGVAHVPSQTNFVATGTWGDGREIVEQLIHHGVITRPIGDAMIRITVGTPEENQRFLGALDVVLGGR